MQPEETGDRKIDRRSTDADVEDGFNVGRFRRRRNDVSASAVGHRRRRKNVEQRRVVPPVRVLRANVDRAEVRTDGFQLSRRRLAREPWRRKEERDGQEVFLRSQFVVSNFFNHLFCLRPSTKDQ